MRATIKIERSESGMTLFAVMGIMAVMAIGLLAVAPNIYQEVQHERENEAIARGEEVAEAIRQYVQFYNGAKLPNSMKDLLDGLPQGTKKRQILRASAAVDPLSEDGKWRLIKADIQTIGPFAKRVQKYNNGALPTNPSNICVAPEKIQTRPSLKTPPAGENKWSLTATSPRPSPSTSKRPETSVSANVWLDTGDRILPSREASNPENRYT